MLVTVRFNTYIDGILLCVAGAEVGDGVAVEVLTVVGAGATTIKDMFLQAASPFYNNNNDNISTHIICNYIIPTNTE